MRILLVAVCFLLHSNTYAACPPENLSRADLQALKTKQWKIEDTSQRQKLALALPACLTDADPVLRDELAFEALSNWMRSAQLDTPTLHSLRQQLLSMLHDTSADSLGFRRPFAALTLAEVARVDRKQPFLSSEQRQEMVTNASNFLREVRDYRGFDEKQGWRHNVAHGADWVLQLALNPALNRAQQQSLLSAISSQVAPAQHAYQYGEGERLASATFYLAEKADLSPAEWQQWGQALLTPLQKAASNSQAKLALRHNLSGYLLPLYFMLQESKDSNAKQKLLPAVTQTLKKID